MTIELTAQTANGLNREDLISWLCWNDRNGVYSDKDSADEGYMPLTRDEALVYVLDQIEG